MSIFRMNSSLLQTGTLYHVRALASKEQLGRSAAGDGSFAGNGYGKGPHLRALPFSDITHLFAECAAVGDDYRVTDICRCIGPDTAATTGECGVRCHVPAFGRVLDVTDFSISHAAFHDLTHLSGKTFFLIQLYTRQY
ncbi:hypothetical protein [Geomobilimonas luticola]|uniref:Uncharacterized protein n=1 Tax=Geomobilimonas luticola TaxID=1114878 RepID=A0ABS5SE98_9BACT|nr:hypothetical protein [Geomobilimonas luticola]MBT0653692.1 hypothetical protein [Geomobilimonas luticola]